MAKLGQSVAAALAAMAAGAICLTPAKSEPPSAPAPNSSQVENWRTSPWHGVVDGDGRVIPCRCRYQGHEYRLGEVVCMQTHLGTVLTRCDLFMNNTSWIPSSEACTISRAPAPFSTAAR
jgi:hypothetical protein